MVRAFGTLFDFVRVHHPVLVSQQRDPVDWLLVGVGLVAGVTAIIAFTQHALEARRRPEIDILWKFSPTGEIADLSAWQQDDAPTVEVGQTILVESSLLNIGDGHGTKPLVNIVVSRNVDFVGETLHSVLQSDNHTAGYPNDPGVKFIVRSPELTKGVWYMTRFKLVVGDPISQGGFRILLSIDDDRFNRSGKRWLPSLLSGGEPPAAPYGQHWPVAPDPNRGFQLVWIEPGVSNGNRIECFRGQRRSIRDVRIEPKRADRA